MNNDINSVVKRGKLLNDPIEINGKLYGDATTTTSRGTPLIVSSVLITTSSRGTIAPIKMGDLVDITFENQRAWETGNPTHMVPASIAAPTTNQAIPANVVNRIDPSDLLKGDNNICLGLKKDMLDLKKMKTYIPSNKQLYVLQHPRNVDSGGIAIVDDAKSGVVQFDKHGNTTEVTQEGYIIKVRAIDTKDSERSRNMGPFGGMTGQETFIADYVPKSNILMPVPTHVPFLAKLMFTIGMVRALANAGRLAGNGLKELRKMRGQLAQVRRASEANEITYKTDRERINKAEELNRIKTAVAIMQKHGKISPEEANTIKSYIDHQAAELHERGSTKKSRNDEFKKIVERAISQVPEIKEMHQNPGKKKIPINATNVII
jgi:hypothetical protein